jgi:GntR family transcriptional regulator/MocR family aminotransferase
VLLAYDRLSAEGYLETRPAAGTLVNSELPDDALRILQQLAPGEPGSAPQSNPIRLAFKGRAQSVVSPDQGRLPIDFWVGRPDRSQFPGKFWRQSMLSHLRRPGANLTEYGEPTGLLRLRQAVADYLGPARGIKASADQVIVVSGIQQALNLVARLLVGKGAPVVTECPCYQGAAFVFESYGARLIPVDVDADGLQVSALPGRSVALAYVTPSHQFPLGATLSLERRLRLLDWARRSRAFIVEDDYDSDFRHHRAPLMALKGLDQEDCVVYLGTFSKAIGAGLRIGYMVVPRQLAGPAAAVKTLMDNGHAWLDQAILADFIASGAFDTHLRRIRKIYLARRDCLVESLRQSFGEVALSGLEGGMHLAWHLPPSWPSAGEIQERARRRGVGIYPLAMAAAHDYGRYGPAERTLILGYTALSEDLIRRGVALIAASLEAPRAGAAATPIGASASPPACGSPAWMSSRK